MSLVINANLQIESGGSTYTKTLYQYDQGVILRLSGVTLPESYQVHFSNDPKKGVSAALIVSGNDIHIPNAYLRTGQYIYVWVFLTEADNKNGFSEYSIIIPVIPRPAILTVNSGESGQIVADLDEDEHALFFRFV